MTRIGFYGGVFSPPTKAHIELAKKAIQECNLDKIIFVPVNDQYKKKGMLNSKHRINMLKIECDKEKKLEISDIETKSKINYKAIDIFEIINKEYYNDEKFFIMGADNLEKITKWDRSEELLKNFNYIILDRGEKSANKIIENDKILKQYRNKFNIVKNDKYKECSSNQIREQLKREEIPENISIEVYEYIRKNNIKF